MKFQVYEKKYDKENRKAAEKHRQRSIKGELGIKKQEPGGFLLFLGRMKKKR